MDNLKDEKTIRLEMVLEENQKLQEQISKYEQQILELNTRKYFNKELEEKDFYTM